MTPLSRILITITFSIICISPVSYADTSYTDNAETKSEKAQKYYIQPGDILSISVWKEEDLKRDVLVRPDSKISFPLIGDIGVSKKTVKDLNDEISKKLSKYIPDPDVSVEIRQINGNTIYILGKVNRPGSYTVGRPTDVMQALSLAGGTSTFAELDNIIVLRRDENQIQQSISFKYSEVEEGENLEQNIILKSGDIVVVP